MAWNRHQRRAMYREMIPRAVRLKTAHDNRIYGPIRKQVREVKRAEAHSNGQ